VRIWFGLLWLSLALFADEPRLVIDSGGHQAVIRFVAFTHDGKYLVSAGDDKTIRIWDIATGKTIRIIRGQIGDGDEGKIFAAALSPDDRYLAVAGWLNATLHSEVIRIHDFQTGNVVALLKGHTNVVESLAFSPDGRYLASGSGDNTVRVWDVATKEAVHVLSGHQDDIYAVAFSPDSQRVVSSGLDKTLRLWDVSSGQLLKEMTGHREPVLSAAFSSDGRYIASGSMDRTIRLWDSRTGEFIKQLATLGGEARGLSFSPDSGMLLTGSVFGDKICHVFEVPSGREVTSFAGHKNIVLATAFSPDGKLAATAGGDQNEVYLWNATNGEVVQRLVGAGQPVWSVGFARDGNSVAFGDSLRAVTQNNLGPLQKTLLLAQGKDVGVSLGESVQSERQFVRAEDRLRDLSLNVKPGKIPETDVLEILRSGKLEHEISRDSTSGFRHTAYSLSPDGALIASGGDNGFLTLYSTSTGQRTAECVGHTSEVWAVAFSPEGKALVSGSYDQTIRLWDVSASSCRNLVTVFVGSDNEWVAWTPQGYYTASANGDKYIGWHVNQGLDQQAKFYPVAQYQKQFYRPDIVAEFLKARDIEVADRTANEKRGGEVRTEKVLGPTDVATNPPPHIVIVEPFDERATANEPLYRVRAVATSDLPVTKFELLVNGASFAGGASGVLKGSPTERQLEAEVPLQPGANKLSFIASNAKAESAPKERVVTYAPRPGSGKMEKPKLILLAIGISKYEHPTFKLDYANKDALDIERTFLGQRGHLYSEVIAKHLVDSEATKENILDALGWLNDQGSDEDIRLVFLSGHGGLDAYGNYYFYAVNHDPRRDPESRDVRWETLLERLTSPKRKAVLIVDSCHAAAVTGGPRPRGDVDFEQVLRDMKSKFRGLFTLAASMGTESSVESTDWQHGAFTKALLDALRNQNEQGKVLSTDDVTNEVKELVKKLTHDEQHPKSTYTETLTEFPIFWVGSAR
jgi:WD40 repeat protein